MHESETTEFKKSLADLGQAGQHGIVANDDHGAACRNSYDLRASSRISSADCPGHAPCLLSTACVSHLEPSSSILRTWSNESTSFEYASAAKASRAARPRFWNPAPSSAARSSGMFTVKVIAPEAIPSAITLQIPKPPSVFELQTPKPSNPGLFIKLSRRWRQVGAASRPRPTRLLSPSRPLATSAALR